jgi:large subunit ribosomal protein L10e
MIDIQVQESKKIQCTVLVLNHLTLQVIHHKQSNATIAVNVQECIQKILEDVVKMGLRNARAYSRKYARPYTRKSKVKSKSYIKTVPPMKIIKFHMGDGHAYESGKLRFIITVISKQRVQIRDNALEACRQGILKDLDEYLPGQYYFDIKKFPHHILRENRVYSGGSKGERVNTGMQMSFGSAIGRAAFVKAGEAVFVIAFSDKKYLPAVRKAISKITPKMCCSTKITFEEKKK